MIFQAVVSNKAHPEYGQATIPFPIPDSDYDHTIELLEGLAVGSPTDQDCRVDELNSGYPILNRLVTQSVNLDELDYLAKRMESFCADENAQIQAVALDLIQGGAGEVTPYQTAKSTDLDILRDTAVQMFPNQLETAKRSPIEAQRSGFDGERSRSGMSEPCRCNLLF